MAQAQSIARAGPSNVASGRRSATGLEFDDLFDELFTARAGWMVILSRDLDWA
jgi:hypothetical protein